MEGSARLREAAKRYGAFVAAGLLGVAGLALGEWSVLAWLGALVFVCVGITLENPRGGIVATALLGLGCSAYLLQLKVAEHGPSICDVNTTVSCSVVNSSAASELFGIPIAVFGIGFFLAVALAGALFTAAHDRLFPTVGVLAAVGCVYSVWLGYQAWLLGATCPMCLTIYACNGILLFAAWRGASALGPLLDGTTAMAIVQSRAAMTIGAAFLVAVLLGHTVYQSYGRNKADVLLDQIKVAPAPPKPAPTAPSSTPAPPPQPVDPNQDLAEQLRELYVMPRGQVQLEGDEPVLGNPNAPYVVLEYACYGCPHCAQALGHLQQLVASDPQIQVRFRSFPLSGECNPAAQPGRPEVCRAAMAAQCAHRQGKFWPYSQMLFQNQRELGDELLGRAARDVGLDFAAFSACMQDPAVLREVEEDAISGAMLQIPGTPAMYVKGVMGDQWLESCMGAQAASAMIAAHKQGIALMAPEAGQCPMHEH